MYNQIAGNVRSVQCNGFISWDQITNEQLGCNMADHVSFISVALHQIWQIHAKIYGGDKNVSYKMFVET